MKPIRGLDWQWAPAVFLYGLERLAATTRQRRYVDALHAYHAHHAQRGLPAIDYPDRCPPALTALALEQRWGDPVGRDSILTVAD